MSTNEKNSMTDNLLTEAQNIYNNSNFYYGAQIHRVKGLRNVLLNQIANLKYWRQFDDEEALQEIERIKKSLQKAISELKQIL